MPVLVNTTESDCQIIVNIMFWRVNEVIGGVARSVLRNLGNPYKFNNIKNMKNLQDLFYDSFVRAKNPIYNEIKFMLGKPTHHPTLTYFRNRIIEMWKLIALNLLEHVKNMGEESLLNNTYLKNTLLSVGMHIINITAEDHQSFGMFTEEFQAENYIRAVGQRYV